MEDYTNFITYGRNGDEDNMNFVTEITFLPRPAPLDDDELYDEVRALLRGPNMISQDGFLRVRGGWRSPELEVLERYINYGRPEGEKGVYGYKKSGPPEVLKYTPPSNKDRNETQPQLPYWLCPPGYEKGFMVLRALPKKQYIPFYEVSPSTTVEEVRMRKLSPEPYGTTPNTLLVLPLQTKIAFPDRLLPK